MGRREPRGIACVVVTFVLVSLVCAYAVFGFLHSDQTEGYLVITNTSIECSKTHYSKNFRDIIADGHAGMLVVTEHQSDLSDHVSSTLCSGLHKHNINDGTKRIANPANKEIRPDISYRLFIDVGTLRPIDVRWSKLRVMPNSSIEIDNMNSINLWIEKQLAKSRGMVVCCTDGEDQCNAIAALYLMYSKCWSLSNVKDFLHISVYSRPLHAPYLRALSTFERFLNTTKCMS